MSLGLDIPLFSSTAIEQRIHLSLPFNLFERTKDLLVVSLPSGDQKQRQSDQSYNVGKMKAHAETKLDIGMKMDSLYIQ